MVLHVLLQHVGLLNLCLMSKEIKKDNWSKWQQYQVNKKLQKQIKGGTTNTIIIEDNINL